MRFRHVFPLLLGLSLTSGCFFSATRQLDKEVQEIAARVGVDPVRSDSLLPPPPPPSRAVEAPTPPPAPMVPTEPDPTRLVALEQPDQSKPPQRLLIPRELPGADAPPIKLPANPAERDRFLRDLYQPIPDLPPLPPPAPGPEGRPLTLSDLQRLAETYSPTVKNAFAAVQAARGAAYDVGQYPNPTIAYEHDTAETGPAGYPGGWFDQVIKTGGKLTVAQAAATMDVVNAELALRRARSDLRYAVRGNYFAVLVALENIRVSEALYRFTREVYRIQVNLVGGAEAAAYEPMQLRPLVLQAQLNLIQAQNQYRASWRQLAANLGLPDMPPTELEGRVDLPFPLFNYQDVLSRLRNHTDVLTAQVSVEKAKYNLKLQKLQPLPDLELRLLVQKDYSTPPNQIAHSATFSMQVPLWDQNKGGIRQYEWLLAQASLGPEQARNTLINTLADAFNRYQTGRRAVEIAGLQVQDQVRVYRGVYARHQQLPGQVSFGDVVTAQQTLVGYLTSYVTALGNQWQAAVDVANLLQAEDLFQEGQHLQQVPALPDLKDLLPPPPPNVPEHPAKAAGLPAQGVLACQQNPAAPSPVPVPPGSPGLEATEEGRGGRPASPALPAGWPRDFPDPMQGRR
jgi:outer membrane protein, heavy metal efflux system